MEEEPRDIVCAELERSEVDVSSAESGVRIRPQWKSLQVLGPGVVGSVPSWSV